MNPSAYSTEHPIVLNIKSHDSTVTHEVITKSIALDVDQAKHTLKMTIDEESCNVPHQYYDALWLLIHHLRVYQMTAIKLMEHPQLDAAQDTYTSITYYYCEVLLAFVKEVKDGWRRKSKTWRSAHMDYHFTMAIHTNAFIEPMQKETLKKIDLTWDDFKKKKIYQPVVERKDMCGVPDTHHDLSVEDMVSSILQQSNERLAEAIKADKAKKKTPLGPIDSATSASTSSHVQDNGMHEAANMADTHEDTSSSNTTETGSRRTKANHIASPRVDNVTDMAAISFKTRNDVRKSRMISRRGRKANASVIYDSRSMSPVDGDMVDETANAFQEKEDGQKGRKTRKGGRKDKGCSKRPSKNPKMTAKSQAIVISDDENLNRHATSQEMDDNPDLAISIGSTAHACIAVTEQEEDMDGIITIQSSPISMHPKSGPQTAARKGKGKAIVLSDDEADGDNPELPPCGQSKQHLGKPQHIDDCGDAPDTNLPAATSISSNAREEDINSEDTNLPSTFEDWEKWNHIAFQNGNSQIFLKLGAWILVRFRQLTQTPINGDVNGILIPDHPRSFHIKSEADFNEALGMTHLYSALTHVDTHPQYLAHLFHELGKASSEGRQECSHPDLRQLPELPTPVLSMMANEQLPWLKALPFEEFVDSVDMDADGDEDEYISMALDDMVISGMHDSAEVSGRQDVLKRKRTTSKALSPPKADGGRGFPKRSRSSHTESFHRPSSPIVQSTSERARIKPLHSVSTQDKGVPIQVIHFLEHPHGFTFPESEGDASMPRSETIADGQSIPSPAFGDTGVVSDISTWAANSEVESRTQISSHLDGNEVAVNTDYRTDDMSGLGTEYINDADGQNVGHVVDKVDGAAGEEISRSHALDEDEWFMNMSGISLPN
ncbi:hypothetical protein DFJ58DRAFT_846067 [Suillus subalutaceus]|uniref:uncharacterized protein n=1 Tax=Suillus subalutaceus TaxID=48586 RepID=UPI001B8739CF|nr:uncharacterized protein DFJ58DRAFT_846067 [Suillus subalutaceus]KAG1838458.1 hypothetical protein DFJ58DRAFT_846067 [Suillus subalutaceus]